MAFFEFTYPLHAEGIQSALEEMNRCLSEHEVDERQGQQIVAIVSEAMSNAVRHGQTSDKPSIVRVSLRVSDSPAPVEVLDQATGGIRLIQNVDMAADPAQDENNSGSTKQYAASVRFADDKDDGLHLVVSLKQKGRVAYDRS